MNHRRFKILILLLVFTTSHHLFGQQSEIDSLVSITQIDSGEKAAKANLEIAKIYSRVQPDTSIYFARKALESAKELDIPPIEAEAHRLLSQYYTSKRNRTESINHSKAIKEITLSDDGLEVMSQFHQAEAWYHYVFENYPEGLESYLQLISICEKLNDPECIYKGLMNSSLIYTTMENYEDANRHLERALGIAQAEVDSMHLLIAHVNISANYRQMHHSDSSVIHAQKGLDIAKAIGSKVGIIKSLNHLAVNSLDLGRFEAAMNYADQILLSDIKDLQSLSLAHKYKAASLDSVGQTQAAFQHAEMSMKVALENGDGKYILNSYEQLYLLHKKSGNNALALDFFEKHEVLKDSLFNLDKNVRINQLKEQYESEKNLLEIASLKQEKAIQDLKHRRNTILLFSLLLGALLIAAAIYFIFRNKSLKQEKESLKVKQRLLRAQINPHFIFNSLNSIQNLVYQNGSGNRAAQYLSNFSSLMRNTLESSFDEYIGLDEEIESIKNYLELQKLRFPGKFEYQIELDGSVDPEELRIPPMLTQPFLENAVLHAFPKVNGVPGKIIVKISKRSNSMEIKILDNGVGIDGEMKQNHGHTSRAIQITRDRLRLLRNGKSNGASIELQDRKTSGETGTEVDITIPLVRAF